MQKAKDILKKIFKVHSVDFNVKLGDVCLMESNGNPKFTLIFRNKKTFKKVMLKMNVMTAGKAFIEGDLDVEGDIFEAIETCGSFLNFRLRTDEKVWLLAKLLTL